MGRTFDAVDTEACRVGCLRARRERGRYRASLASCFAARPSRTRRLLCASHSPGKPAIAALGAAGAAGADSGGAQRFQRRALCGSRRPGSSDGKRGADADCSADAGRSTDPRADADRSPERRPDRVASEPERAAEADDGPEAEARADRHACPADTLV